MPHAWIASDFLRSILDALAYDREDGALGIGAGAPRRWLGHGILHIDPLPTYTGTIDLRMHAEGDTIVAPTGNEVAVPGLPARVVFEY